MATYARAIATMACPKCGARPGEDCFKPDGRKWSEGKAHLPRVQALERSQKAAQKEAT